MAPAIAALAPSLMSKAEGIAATVLKESRQEIVVLRFNDELDIVGPKEPHAFKVTITPALIGTLGLIGIALYIIVAYMKWKSTEQGKEWTTTDTVLATLSPGYAYYKVMGGKTPW